MRFLALVAMVMLAACGREIRPESLPQGYLGQDAWCNRLELVEHAQSQPWRRVFSKGGVFVTLEPGCRRARVGSELVDLGREARLWRGKLHLGASSLTALEAALRPLPTQRGVHPEWVPLGERGWTHIVVHHSADEVGNADIYDRYHREVRGWDRGLGYHFVIGNGSASGMGQVEIGPRWRKQCTGAHAKTPDNTYNENGIGVCLVGNYEIHDEVPEAQLSALVELVRFLMDRYKVPWENVIMHKDVPGGTHTECPGAHFPWGAFKDRLR